MKSNRPLWSRPPLLAAGFTGLVSVLALLGWWLENDTLKSVLPGWVSMKPNTAIGLFLSSVALALLAGRRTGFTLRAVGLTSGMLIALGTVTLGQYFFGFDDKIDQAFFPDSVRLLMTSHPGRMAPTTAYCLLVLGMAFFMASRSFAARLRLPLVMALGGAVALIGLFSVAGYAADSLMGSRWWAYSGMAVHTAGSFVLLGSGLILLARSEESFIWFLDRPTTIGFLSGIVLMLLAAQLAFNQTGELLDAGGLVTHRHETLEELEKIASVSALMESSQRGYLVTGDERLLEERGPAGSERLQAADAIRRFTANNPRQQVQIAELEALLAERDAWEEQTIATREKGGTEAVAEMVMSGQGRALRDRVNEVLRKMEDEEFRLLAVDKASADATATVTFLLLPLGVFLSLSILLGGMFFLNAGIGERDLAERDRLAAFQKHDVEMARLNRLYAALSHVNQAISRLPDRDALFVQVCRVLVEYGGFRMAWIGWQDTKTRRLVPVAHWGDIEGYMENAVIHTDDRPEGQGPNATAFREGRPSISNDFFEDASTQSSREQAVRHGLKASAAFPIRLRDATCGALTVYAGEVDFFQKDETALLKEVADDVSFAVETFLLREEHEQAELRARREAHFSQAMIESMPGIVYLYDEQRRFQRWNRNFAEVSGYTADEIARMHPLDFSPEEEKCVLAQRIAEVFDEGESFVEASFRTKDGRTIPYFFTGRRIVFEGVPCLIGMGIDVSERHRAEEALRKSEERYRTTLDGMMEGCQFLGFDWQYLFVNEAAARQNRRPAADVLGRTMLEAWPGIEATAVFAMLRRTMDERISLSMETEFFFPDGASGWFELRCQPIPEGIFILSIDISERKQAQRELQALNATLERRVAGRTMELRVLNKELESFSYSVSHDLRAPLRSIAGFTQILEETCGPTLDETSRDYFSRVLAATARMGDLIDDLLKLSRVTRDEFHRENVDLSELARAVTADLRQHDAARKVEVVIADGLETQGDPRLLRIVLENLLGNAWKFTTKKSVACIEFGACWDGEDRTFFIRDNGAGFDMRYADKLFAPFQRLHRMTEFPGSGIGLATVQRVLHRHGGRVWAEAAVNQGATFRFVIESPESP